MNSDATLSILFLLIDHVYTIDLKLWMHHLVYGGSDHITCRSSYFYMQAQALGKSVINFH